MSLEIVPISLREANAYVEQNHRHHGKVTGHKFSIGLSDGEKIVGDSIGKTVWLWTGFVWEDIWNPYFPDEDSWDNHKTAQAVLLTSCDVAIDGPFKQELVNMALKWRGSANQRVIDVQKKPLVVARSCCMRNREGI